MRRWVVFLAAAVVLAVMVGSTRASTAVRATTAQSSGVASTDAQAATADDASPADLTDCFQPLHASSLPGLRRLPWPIVLTTGCGHFVALPSGILMRAPAEPGVTPYSGYRVPAGPGTWVNVVQGHVVFVQRGITVWRSAGGAYDPQNLGSAVLGRGWVAFSVSGGDGSASPMYFSRGADPERVLSVNEDPIVLTRWGGFMTSRWRSDGSNPDLVARRGDGSLMSTLALRVTTMFPETRGTVLYLKARKLWRTDGVASVLLSDLSSFGSIRYVNVEPLADGRILVSGLNRIAVLGPNGRTESSAALAPIPKGGWGFIGIHTMVPHGKGLVVAATRWNDEMMGGGQGWEGVYLLRPGARTARLLFGGKLNIAICAHSAVLTWHAQWLLYSACEGRVVAIDTTGKRAPIDLSGLARSVPIPRAERGSGLEAVWAAYGRLPQALLTARLG